MQIFTASAHNFHATAKYVGATSRRVASRVSISASSGGSEGGTRGAQEYIALRCWRVQQMRLQHFQFTTPNCLPVSSGFRIRIAIHIGIIRNWIFTHWSCFLHMPIDIVIIKKSHIICKCMRKVSVSVSVGKRYLGNSWGALEVVFSLRYLSQFVSEIVAKSFVMLILSCLIVLEQEICIWILQTNLSNFARGYNNNNLM